MSISMRSEIRTLAYVLRRTNYGEADRIINVITPEGKMSVIAKGVRKEKSRLAGGIEMFALNEMNIHRGKKDLGVVTSAKMLIYYNNLLGDFNRMELAATILKNVSRLAESSDSPEYFGIVDQSLKCLNAGADERLVEAWARLNLMRVSGEEINLYRDNDGEKLIAEQKYVWDYINMGFAKKENGEFGANEIKFLRLMLTAKLEVVMRVKEMEMMLPIISQLVRGLSRNQ